jgi:cytochrome P450
MKFFLAYGLCLGLSACSSVSPIVITAPISRSTSSVTKLDSQQSPAAGSEPSFLSAFSHAGLGLFRGSDLLRLHLQVFGKWLEARPRVLFDDLRSHQPIFKMASIPMWRPGHPNTGTVVVSRADDVIEILSHPEAYTVEVYHEKMSRSLGEHMLGSDQTKLNSVEKPWMRKMMPREDGPRIVGLVDQFAKESIASEGKTITRPDGTRFTRLEVVSGLARRVPALLSGAYFGFPGPDLQTVFRWSRSTQYDYFHNLQDFPNVHHQARRSGSEMLAYAKALIENKLENRGSAESAAMPVTATVLDRLVASREVRTAELTDDRIGVNIIATLVAGIETTNASVVQALQELFARPEILAKAISAAEANDDVTLSKYVWEALRFRPINPVLVRYAPNDTVLAKGTDRETIIPKGTLVMASVMSAMFDESVVPNAQTFSIDRPDSTYFHFGYGHHQCLGEMVGKIEVPLIIKNLLLQKNLRLTETTANASLRSNNPFPEDFTVEFDQD